MSLAQTIDTEGRAGVGPVLDAEGADALGAYERARLLDQNIVRRVEERSPWNVIADPFSPSTTYPIDLITASSGLLLPLPRVVVKAANQSRNTTTTFADDPHLTLPVVANGVYLIEAWIEWTAGAGGVKFQFSLPSGATFLVWRALAGSSPSASTNGILLNDTNAGTFAMRLTGLIRIASTAGNCALRWAQSTSNGANTTLNSGSTITLRKTA